MTMNTLKISKRLEAAASFVRRGVRIADIGSDHAYLPIYLYSSGLISGGVASDINEGPVKRGEANVRLCRVENAIEVRRADGLSGIEKYDPDDIFIFGMGGELIVSIVDGAKWLRDARYRLILQPMTHPEILRRYLFDNGFSIICEKLIKDDKIYQIICAEYSGKSEEADELELLFGKHILAQGGELLREALLRSKDIYSERIMGKRIASADASAEELMIEKIDKKISLMNGGE